MGGWPPIQPLIDKHDDRESFRTSVMQVERPGCVRATVLAGYDDSSILQQVRVD